ncbi:MAG: N-acetylmuramoyl-L-alanine amidase [Holophagaceae bacterium]
MRLRSTVLVPLLSLAAGVLAAQQPATPPAAAEAPKPAARLRIALDAGHGGDDQGAKGKGGLLEKSVALALATALAEKLMAYGYEPWFTRPDDRFIPLWDRAKLANEAGADLFVSLHLNASRARGAKGSEVYFLSLGEGDVDAETLAAENGPEPSEKPADPEGLVAGILEDLAQKAYLQDSERLAVEIQTQLNLLGGIKERGVKQAPFVVLKGAAMPAVLVETAFITNPKEEAKLKDPAFLQKAAESIARGIRTYLLEANGSVRRRAAQPAR